MQRICKKCLIREMDASKYFQNMYAYIENLNPDNKTEFSLYEERLKICKTCEDLINGMCKQCGCFVEMRAAIKNNYCPSFHRKW